MHPQGCGNLDRMPASSPSCRAIPVALCLGGMDSSAGAGLLRDVMTLSALGAHPMAVCTAETIQNGLECLQVLRPFLSPVRALEALRPHLTGVWGVKLGLCALAADELRELMAVLNELGPNPRIWDPIQAPTSGVALHDPLALRRMAEIILGTGGWVVSPNRLEAAAVGAMAVDAEPAALAEAFLGLGAKAVWLKGGHASGNRVEDFWIDSKGVSSLGIFPRLPGDRRGTGCTLASAWLAFRLRGLGDMVAAEHAAAWLRERWSDAVLPGGVGRPCLLPVQI